MTRLLAIAMIVGLSTSALFVTSADAAVDYTANAVTTDSDGTPKSDYIAGERVYVNVDLMQMGVPYNGSITVSLVRTSDGATISHYDTHTDEPATGTSYGYLAGLSLVTGMVPYESMTFDVVVNLGWTEVARTPIVVMFNGLRITPDKMYFYPGDEQTITLSTLNTAELFYVAVVNDTGAAWANWTNLIAFDGSWSTTWILPANLPDGDFSVLVRSHINHLIWYESSFTVRKYELLVMRERDYCLPGETVGISYKVVDISTLEPPAGVTVSFTASWLNESGGLCSTSGSLVGTEGVQAYIVPADIALYSDTTLNYWANETASGRSVAAITWLYTGLIQGTLSVDRSSSYHPSDEVVVTVYAHVGYNGLPGATVDISVEKNSIAVPGLGATGLVTDSEGYVTYRMDLPNDAPAGSYAVAASISKMGFSVTRMVTFNVAWSGQIQIALDKAYYLVGDTVTASVQAVWNGQVLANYTVGYVIMFSSTMIVTGSTSDGTISFTIPTDAPGFFLVEGIAEVDGYQILGVKDSVALAAEVLVIAEKSSYAPLDRAMFDYAVLANIPVTGMEYRIIDLDGRLAASGSIPYSSNGSIAFDVPESPSAGYRCELVVTLAGGQSVSAYDDMQLYGDYELVINVGESPYLSGAFKPGDTLDIAYDITPRGTPNLPLYELDFFTTMSDSVYTFLTSSTEGGIQMQIPASVQNGLVYLEVNLNNALTDEYLCDFMVTVTVSDTADSLDITFDDLQNETELLKDQLNSTLDALNATAENNSQMANDLDDLQRALDDAMGALNASLDKLGAMQENMSSLQDELESVNGQVSDSPSGSTIALLAVALIAVGAVAAILGVLVMRSRKAV